MEFGQVRFELPSRIERLSLHAAPVARFWKGLWEKTSEVDSLDGTVGRRPQVKLRSRARHWSGCTLWPIEWKHRALDLRLTWGFLPQSLFKKPVSGQPTELLFLIEEVQCRGEGVSCISSYLPRVRPMQIFCRKKMYVQFKFNYVK